MDTVYNNCEHAGKIKQTEILRKCSVNEVRNEKEFYGWEIYVLGVTDELNFFGPL